MQIHLMEVEGKWSLAMSFLGVVAMGLVVCHHLPTQPRGGVLEWGVPWFYFASGFWYASKLRKWREEISKRISSLLVPYYLLNVIWFPILFLANWIGWKYLGAERVVDGGLYSSVRCLGLSPWSWPALVPTWFLRSLFVATVVVAGIWAAFDAVTCNSRWARVVIRALVAAMLWAIVFTMPIWCPADGHWVDFFVFGVPLHGMACFAMGGLVSSALYVGDCGSVHPFAARIRRQMMPVYVLHAVVIVACGAILLGEALRRCSPSTAKLLFGGR